MLPDQLVLDQAVGSHEIGSDGAVLHEAHDARVPLLPVGVGTALRLVDLHHGGVQCLKVEQEQRDCVTPRNLCVLIDYLIQPNKRLHHLQFAPHLNAAINPTPKLNELSRSS